MDAVVYAYDSNSEEVQTLGKPSDDKWYGITYQKYKNLMTSAMPFVGLQDKLKNVVFNMARLSVRQVEIYKNTFKVPQPILVLQQLFGNKEVVYIVESPELFTNEVDLHMALKATAETWEENKSAIKAASYAASNDPMHKGVVQSNSSGGRHKKTRRNKNTRRYRSSRK